MVCHDPSYHSVESLTKFTDDVLHSTDDNAVTWLRDVATQALAN